MQFFWWPELSALLSGHMLYMGMGMVLGSEPTYAQFLLIRFGANTPAQAFGLSLFWALITLILIGVGIARTGRNRSEKDSTATQASKAS